MNRGKASKKERGGKERREEILYFASNIDQKSSKPPVFDFVLLSLNTFSKRCISEAMEGSGGVDGIGVLLCVLAVQRD